MYRKLYLARGLRTLGTMAAAGVTLVESVQAAANICKNTYFCELWTSASQQIEQGKQLSEPMFASPLVPRSVCQMMSSAEKSGQLLRVMEQIATYSEQELKERIAEMTRYIEPVMIVVMGFIIGGVALAMLLPILTFSRVMGH
jgi:type IV pilus assembly protein PilC